MPLLSHTNWRDCQEWRSFGIEMSTTSNEACKMYDASLAQFISAYDDPSLGGMEGTLNRMLEADPGFVPGIALKLTLTAQFAGKRAYNDQSLAEEAKKMMALAGKPHVTEWERNHARAANLYIDGQRDKAADVLEDILIDHPCDMAAIKFASGMYIENGYYPRLRDCCGRVLPYWKQTTPFYGDLLSWYGFGLEETNYFQKAEQVARQALDINPNDSWAVHCIAHIREMNGEIKDGLAFMEQTENDWNKSMMDCHNYWHWALFHYENGDFEASRGILDAQLLPLMRKYKSPFSLTDVASLMYRLDAEGLQLDGWDESVELSLAHIEDYAWSYTDVNAMLSCCGGKRKDEADTFVNNVKKVIKGIESVTCSHDAIKRENLISTYEGDNPRVYKEATLPVLEAIQAYGNADFDRAVECLKPVRYELHKIGGSNAQRDLFNVLLIQSAIRSKKYQKYANHLIYERQSIKGETPLMKKMLQKLVVEH